MGTRGAPGDVGSESWKLNSPDCPGGMATCTSKLGWPRSVPVKAGARWPLASALTNCRTCVARRRTDVSMVPLGMSIGISGSRPAELAT